jgi:hypothetical protein
VSGNGKDLIGIPTHSPTGNIWRSYYYAGGQRMAMRVQGTPTQLACSSWSAASIVHSTIQVRTALSPTSMGI